MWKGIIADAGDIYTDDLMFGNRKAGMSGHWKDQLPLLERSLAALRQELADAGSNSTPADTALWEAFNKEFDPAYGVRFWKLQVVHTPITTARSDKPLTITAQ